MASQTCINSTLDPSPTVVALMKKAAISNRKLKHVRKLTMKHSSAKTSKRLPGKNRIRCAAPSTPVRPLNKSRKVCAKLSTPVKVLNKGRKTCTKASASFKAMKRSQETRSKASTPLKAVRTSTGTPRKVMVPSTPMRAMVTSKTVRVMKASRPMKVMKACTPVRMSRAASRSGPRGVRMRLAKNNAAKMDNCSDEEPQESSAASRGCTAKGKSKLLMLGRTAMVGRSGSAKTPQKCSSHADALRKFLMNPIGVTTEPAAFQLRCVQKAAEGEPARTVVFVVGGKCRLWKLNQVLAECFDLSEEEFSYEPLKGRPALGSRLVVTRPLEPGKCSKALVCSKRSAIVGGQIDCADDRNHSVAELFRGKSTRDALEQLPADAAQRVCFMSPSLETEVVVSLDGIMLDSYDSHTLFDQDKKNRKKRPALDKMRRHCNGRRPLPRIVRSSFLSTAEIEAKNIFMQGSREGPDFLLKIATPWSSLHESCRRSQRKPLFRKDGRDFDLNDLCHVNRDVESDAEHSD